MTGPMENSLPASRHGEVAGLVEELRAGLEGVTPGPWDVWPERIDGDRYAAIAELTDQVHATSPVADHLYLINAGGKCPATTGCGPCSEANAAHIARCSPDNIAKLLDHINALTAQLAAPTPSPVEARADGVRVKALAETEWAIKTWRGSMTPAELAKAIFDAPAMQRLIAALESTPAQPVREGQEGKAEPVARVTVYMHEGRRQTSINEIDGRLGGLSVGNHDLFASQPDPAAEIARLTKERDEARAAWKEATEGWDLSIGQTDGARNLYRAAEARAERAESELAVIREAVKPLVQACYDEMHGPECDDDPDDEHVASTWNEAGEVVPAGDITFGMIRRARAALANTADRGQEEKGK